MVIQAKFKSICPTCQKEISVGEKVEWKNGLKAIHEKCHKQTQEAVREQTRIEHENKPFRVFDEIEVNEDIFFHGTFGNKEPERIAFQGIKGTIIESNVRSAHVNGKYQEVVMIQEKVRKGKEPKTKKGYFFAPLELITIIKKAK